MSEILDNQKKDIEKLEDILKSGFRYENIHLNTPNFVSYIRMDVVRDILERTDNMNLWDSNIIVNAMYHFQQRKTVFKNRKREEFRIEIDYVQAPAGGSDRVYKAFPVEQ